MEREFRTAAFWAAMIISTIIFLAVLTAALWAFLYIHAHSPSSDQEHMASLAMTYGTLVTGAGCLFASIAFGWRRERHEARQMEQELIALKFQLEESRICR